MRIGKKVGLKAVYHTLWGAVAPYRRGASAVTPTPAMWYKLPLFDRECILRPDQGLITGVYRD